MPSYDLVSKVDMGEFKNVVNQAVREINGRYDFKGSNVSLELKESTVELKAEDEYKMKAALDILRNKMIKRGIGMNSLEPGDINPSGNRMLKQDLFLHQGIDKDKGKQINKIVKNSGLKVTSQLMDDKIRITGKKIDDLQSVFSMLKSDENLKLELQMENMKR